MEIIPIKILPGHFDAPLLTTLLKTSIWSVDSSDLHSKEDTIPSARQNNRAHCHLAIVMDEAHHDVAWPNLICLCAVIDY
jgi:hypothetical protein